MAWTLFLFTSLCSELTESKDWWIIWEEGFSIPGCHGLPWSFPSLSSSHRAHTEHLLWKVEWSPTCRQGSVFVFLVLRCGILLDQCSGRTAQAPQILLCNWELWVTKPLELTTVLFPWRMEMCVWPCEGIWWGIWKDGSDVDIYKVRLYEKGRWEAVNLSYFWMVSCTGFILFVSVFLRKKTLYNHCCFLSQFWADTTGGSIRGLMLSTWSWGLFYRLKLNKTDSTTAGSHSHGLPRYHVYKTWL